MAYMNQEKKAALAPLIKDICKRHGVKATLSVRNHSTLILTIKSGSIDFFADRVPGPYNHTDVGYLQVNEYRYKQDFVGPSLAFFQELLPAMNIGNHDQSDAMTDYFDVGWYTEVQVGRWDKHYALA